ncbi:N-6 DNA methylase [Psychrobacter urativorans]|uniref:N-6 DNA methylase n=1 Tax=Psychrobacter urativorans TaxID=45610 RepID=UPI0039B78B41
MYLLTLNQEFGYPYERMQVEYPVAFGRQTKRADIVIFDKDHTTSVYIMVEMKKPKLKDGKDQLKSYCHATGAPIGVWTNGESISFYNRRDPNYFKDIPRIPQVHETLPDVLTERWTIETLIQEDKLVNERKSLKDIILEMEDEVLANAGVDVFEELFQLIFTKLYDEMESTRNKIRHLEFRNYGETETQLKEKIQNLFDEAKSKWEGVFSTSAKITLAPSHLAICISSLEQVKLFNSNLDVVDEAFEYLINKSSKGEKGQYFTPRYVIDMCVKMLDPKPEETIIDTAAGSCGFPVHSIFHVWEKQLKARGLEASHLFTAEERFPEQLDYVTDKVFAIDFDEKAVRVARTLNLIAGDGQTNVLHLNTLDYERWSDKTEDEDWRDIYHEGWKRLRKLRATKNQDRDFIFDVLMANPPFAGDIKESRILSKYELGHKTDGKQQSKVGRDILFIERNLDFLKPGGRMAVVLPQGRFNNSSDKHIREFIAGRCRILSVVGLHGNVFKPHTGTKTSVLLVQKWNDDPQKGVLCPKIEDYPIFFATMQEPSKDSGGEKIFVKKSDYPQANTINMDASEDGVAEVVNTYNSGAEGLDDYLLDNHGHLIVKHDLFNHDGLTQDGIAEAFVEFAKKEKLSFVGKS